MRQLTGHTYASLDEQVYAIAAMDLLEKFTGERAAPLGSNDSTEYVLGLATNAHSKIQDILGVYLKPSHIESLYRTASVYEATSWSELALGKMKEINANPLLLLQTTHRIPLAEVIFRMAYGNMHPMVPNSEHKSWRFDGTKNCPELHESNYFPEASRVDLNYLTTFGEKDLGKRGVVEVKLGVGCSDILRMEWRRAGIWYGLKRTSTRSTEMVNYSLPDLFTQILNLGFVGTDKPLVTTRWECNLDIEVPVGYGVIIPHNQINHYGALRLK